MYDTTTFDAKPTDSSEANSTARSNRYLVDISLNETPLEVVGAHGNYLQLSNGQEVFDATGGAAVACLGHGNQQVKQVIMQQMDITAYCNPILFTTRAPTELSKEIIRGTENLMSRVYLCSSGSEATDATMKMSRQYFIELSQPQRINFINREQSYHGNTIGALSVSNHVARRALYAPILTKNVSSVSACNPYRQRLPDESDPDFVARKAAELDAKFQILGPDTVIAFICEPISGAALGCVPYVRGYLAAMKAICRKYGALFILDETMCGMGRSGTLHAWQGEHIDGDPNQDCLPDLEMIGKGLGGGYQCIAGVIASKKIIEVIATGPGGFIHGQTYQAHPIACAAALAVQSIIRRKGLISNVQKQGLYLSQQLRRKLGSHPHIGDIRGMGLFWGIEFVQDKETKEPFPKAANVAGKVSEMALKVFGITFYCLQGTADGVNGDHLIIAPAYDITREDADVIVTRLEGVIGACFSAQSHSEPAFETRMVY